MKKILLIKVLFFLGIFSLFGEGTKNLLTADPDNTPIMLKTAASTADQNGMAVFSTRFANNRLCVYAKAGEVVYFGFTALSGTGLVRVLNPDGKTEILRDTVFETPPTTKRKGYIASTRNLAVNPGATGSYISNSFVANVTGTYFFEFYTPTTKLTIPITIKYFDVSVYDPGTKLFMDGRLFSKNWNFIHTSTTPLSFDYLYYILSGDSIVSRVSSSAQIVGNQLFRLQANNYGVHDSNNSLTDRVSAIGSAYAPGYNVYLNNPTYLQPETKTSTIKFPSTVLLSGCPGAYYLKFENTMLGFADIIIDIDGNGGYNPGVDVIISEALKKLYDSIPWNGLDALGKPVSPGSQIKFSVNYYKGLVNLPSTFTSNGKGFFISANYNKIAENTVSASWDDLQLDGLSDYNCSSSCHLWPANTAPNTYNTWWYISKQAVTGTMTVPYFYAGTDDLICSHGTKPLSGQSIGNTSFIWKTTGNGTFSPLNSLATSYKPSPEDIQAGSVTLTLGSTDLNCRTPAASLNLRIIAPPAISAGPDITQCIPVETTSLLKPKLAGSAPTPTKVKWTTNGNGQIYADSVSSTSYTVSPIDYTKGTFQVVLSSVGDQRCPTIRDTANITLSYRPTVTARPDFRACFNNIQLTATASNYNSLEWQSLATLPGTLKDKNALITYYTPSAIEKNNGQAKLRIIARGAAVCPVDTSEVTATIESPIQFTLGADRYICVSKDSIEINLPFTNFVWGGSGSGSFGTGSSPTGSSRTAYKFIPKDTLLNSLIVWAEPNPNVFSCTGIRDSVKIFLEKLPAVNAGADFSACVSNIFLNGSSPVSQNVEWTGAGEFGNKTALSTRYIPLATEIAQGYAKLLLRGYGGKCPSQTDEVTVTISQTALVNIGADRFACTTKDTILINALSANFTWGSNGSGVFGTDTRTGKAFYTFNAKDFTLPYIWVYGDPNANLSACGGKRDSLKITFENPVSVNAGASFIACQNIFTLKGTAQNAPKTRWEGNGLFSGSTLLTTNYTPTTDEIKAGKSTVRLIAYDTKACPSDTAELTVKIIIPAVANLGADRTICSTKDTIQLKALADNFNFGTSGNGIFSAGSGNNNTYAISATDRKLAVLKLWATPKTGVTECGAKTDTIAIFLAPVPQIQTSAIQTNLCSGRTASLRSTVSSGVSAFSWNVDPAKGKLDAIDKLDPVFTPTSFSEQVTVTLTGSSIYCGEVKSSVVLNYFASPEISLSNDLTVCADTSEVRVTSESNNAWAVNWTSLGAGRLTPETSGASYKPSLADTLKPVVLYATATSSNTFCPSVSDTLKITVLPFSRPEAGDNISACGDLQITLNGKLSGPKVNTIWTSTGGGNFEAGQLITTYIADQEDLLVPAIRFVLSTVKSGLCKSHSDTMYVQLNSGPSISAGENQEVCVGSNVNLTGSTTAGEYFWTGGNGNFSDTKIANPVYTPSAADIEAGQVKLTFNTQGTTSCPSELSEVTITFVPSPTIEAGVNQNLCNGTNAELKANAGNLSLVKWTTSGSGQFVPSDLNDTATYVPSPADQLKGSVTLTLHSLKENCPAVKDDLVLTYKPVTRTYAGPDLFACKTGGSVIISGRIVNGTSGVWSGGNGQFSPSPTSLVVGYTPTADELAAGSLTLTLLPTKAECTAGGDEVTISFNAQPTSEAGENFEICGNNNIQLSGKITNANVAKWTGGEGSFTPNAFALNAVYIPTSFERLKGSVTLTLTTIANGTCVGGKDSITVRINTAPSSFAGQNQTLVKTGVQLNGVVKNANGGFWKSSGDGTFIPGPTTLNAIYVPSDKDMADKRVVLRLFTTGNGSCSPAVSEIILLAKTVVCKVKTEVLSNANVFTFIATNDDNTSIGSYKWDFGNGISGSGKIQSNVYNKPGKYVSTLTYSNADSSCTAYAKDTIVITSANIPTYKIAGKAVAGTLPLDSGKAVLYKFDGKRYYFLRSQEISVSDTGKFTFTGLKNDYYIVHVIPSVHSDFFAKFEATYTGDSIRWKHSEPIKIDNADETGKIIKLKSVNPVVIKWDGSGKILGTIVFEDTVKSALLRVTSESENPVENAVITLYNSNTDRLTSTVTDPYGNYSFDGLEPGAYDVLIEYPGTNQSSTSRIDVGNNAASGNNVALFENQTNAGIHDNKFTLKEVSYYPNPVSDHLTIIIPDALTDENAVLKIVNTKGQVVFKGKTGNGSAVSVNTSRFDQGLYLIEISTESEFYLSKFNKL